MTCFRTARGHDSGAALTFVTPAEEKLLSELETRLLKGAGSDVSGSALIKPYKFHMSEIEGFRYRVKVRMVKNEDASDLYIMVTSNSSSSHSNSDNSSSHSSSNSSSSSSSNK